jgi:hypothetical protein
MEKVRSYAALWMTLLGGLIGGMLATWFAPKMISWYFKPGAPMGVDCVPSVEKAMHQLALSQAGGVVGGGVLGLLIFFAFSKRRHPPQQPAQESYR